MIYPNNFQEKSYNQHNKHFEKYRHGGKKESDAKLWLKNDTVDAWRHLRMYQALNPILKLDKGAKWLTIGDGRFGKDAKYILDNGSEALATDISDHLLTEAFNKKFITKFQKENAESLSFNDSEFDYVFCKESYHHFPRPMIALYEMLRVAKKGIVLIEPNDKYVENTIMQTFFSNLKKIYKKLTKKYNKHQYEESGNYIFSTSRREIEKVSLGLNYKTVAFKGINDFYFKGVEHEKISNPGPLYKKINILLTLSNTLCKVGFEDYKILISIIFKKDISGPLADELSNHGYDVVKLPRNPYIDDL